MSDAITRPEGVRWNIALRVWWAEIWRGLAAILIIIVTPGLFLSIFMRGNHTIAWVLYIALFVLAAPIGLWATRESLKAGYGSFSIAIKEGDKIEGVTWMIALRVLWAQIWRGSVMMAGVYGIGALLLRGWYSAALMNQIVGTPLLQTIAMQLLQAVVGIWAVRESLRANYRSFSIIIREQEGADI